MVSNISEVVLFKTHHVFEFSGLVVLHAVEVSNLLLSTPFGLNLRFGSSNPVFHGGLKAVVVSTV